VLGRPRQRHKRRRGTCPVPALQPREGVAEVGRFLAGRPQHWPCGETVQPCRATQPRHPDLRRIGVRRVRAKPPAQQLAHDGGGHQGSDVQGRGRRAVPGPGPSSHGCLQLYPFAVRGRGQQRPAACVDGGAVDHPPLRRPAERLCVTIGVQHERYPRLGGQRQRRTGHERDQRQPRTLHRLARARTRLHHGPATRNALPASRSRRTAPTARQPARSSLPRPEPPLRVPTADPPRLREAPWAAADTRARAFVPGS